MPTFNKKRFKPIEKNVLKLSLMKKYGFPLREINRLITSIKVSVVQLVTNSRCISCSSASKYKYICFKELCRF